MTTWRTDPSADYATRRPNEHPDRSLLWNGQPTLTLQVVQRILTYRALHSLQRIGSKGRSTAPPRLRLADSVAAAKRRATESGGAGGHPYVHRASNNQITEGGKQPMSRTHKDNKRNIRVEGVRRHPVDMRRLARALIELARAEAEATAEQEHGATKPDPSPIDTTSSEVGTPPEAA